MRGFPYRLFCTLVLSALAGNVLVGVGEAGEALPWGVERIRANKVWDANGDMIVDPGSINGTAIRIAILDTGIDSNHPDLASNVKGGRSWFLSQEWYEDPSDHGTPVVGTIAAVDNDEGVIGGAPKAGLYMAKISLGRFSPIEFLVDAIRWTVDNWYPHIISMSLGGLYEDDPDLHAAVDYAYAHNVVLIAGSGNDNRNEMSYPARYANVTAVGAVDENNQRWVDSATVGSNYGPELDLVAPGVNIYSTSWDNTYGNNTGTSFAVPHVTAVAALVLQSKINPVYDSNGDGYWQNNEVYNRLIGLAKDLGPPGRDDEYGHGLVDAVLRDTAISFATSYKTVQGMGYPLKIFVAVKNLGITAENMDVEAYVLNPSGQRVFDQWINDTQLLGGRGASTTLTFTWNTQGSSPKGIYTILAYSPPPEEDVDSNNNYNFDGAVNITIAGDINGDYIVNVIDAILISTHWGHGKSFENPGHVPYDWNFDINGDCAINAADGSILSLNYGQDP